MKKYLLKMTAFILIVASTMIVNVTAPGCAADRNLIYSGTYADLIEIEDQKIPPSSGEVQVKKVDTETGLPAAASMTQVGVFGNEINRINTVRFNYEGRPAMLHFTNDVADGFTYLDEESPASHYQIVTKGVDYDFLCAALADYTNQVKAAAEIANT